MIDLPAPRASKLDQQDCLRNVVFGAACRECLKGRKVKEASGRVRQANAHASAVRGELSMGLDGWSGPPRWAAATSRAQIQTCAHGNCLPLSALARPAAFRAAPMLSQALGPVHQFGLIIKMRGKEEEGIQLRPCCYCCCCHCRWCSPQAHANKSPRARSAIRSRCARPPLQMKHNTHTHTSK